MYRQAGLRWASLGWFLPDVNRDVVRNFPLRSLLMFNLTPFGELEAGQSTWNRSSLSRRKFIFRNRTSHRMECEIYWRFHPKVRGKKKKKRVAPHTLRIFIAKHAAQNVPQSSQSLGRSRKVSRFLKKKKKMGKKK